MKKALSIVLMMSVLCLIACGSKPIHKVEYIYPTIVVPEEPTYFSVEWQKINDCYCLSIDNAKNLLKNFQILNTYKNELKIILIDLQNLKGDKNGATYP